MPGLPMLVAPSALFVFLLEYLLSHTASISLPNFSLMATLAAGSARPGQGRA